MLAVCHSAMRQHARRHAVQGRIDARGAAEFADQPGAGAFAVQQQRGVSAAGAAVGREQGAQALAVVDGARRGVGQGPARAHRGARAAAHAQVRLDDDAAALPAGLRRGRRDLRRRAHAAAALALQASHRCGSRASSRHRCRRCSRSARCGCARTAWACSGRTWASRIRRRARAIAARRRTAWRRRCRRGSSPAAAGASRTPAARAGRARGRSLRWWLARARSKSIAPAASQATHAVAVALAPRQVDLVAEVDRALGADRDAGIAARAQVQVDRVVGCPTGFEGAEPAAQIRSAARCARRDRGPAPAHRPRRRRHRRAG